MRYLKTYEELNFNNITIELLKVEYALEVSEVIKSAVLYNYKDSFSKNMIDIYLKHYSAEPIISRMNSIYSIVLKEGNRIVGTGSIDSKDYITAVYILPNCQGKGYGKMIINYVISKCKEKGLGVAKLQATPTSKSFYQ